MPSLGRQPLKSLAPAIMSHTNINTQEIIKKSPKFWQNVTEDTFNTEVVQKVANRDKNRLHKDKSAINQ